jgi:multidrug efflux pump subunit AcrA (membrane-fusion protein)
MFVEASILGRELPGAVSLPRHAVRSGDTIWLVFDGKLSVRAVEVARRDEQEAIIALGLVAGDRVVVSSLDPVTDGMSVRSEAGEPEESPGPEPST